MAGVPASAQTRPAAAIPRAADGKPDLSGIWQVLHTSAWLDIQDHSAEKDVPAGQGIVVGNDIPYLPAALEKRKANYASRGTADPVLKCYLPGVPRITYMPFPFQIFQTPQTVGILYEYVHAVREVHLNSAHLEGPIEWWMGDSRGKWDGDTLVVDVNNFNDQTWFDRAGNHHSEALHVVERYSLLDADHLSYEATIEDPKVFSRPWTLRLVLYRHREPNFQLLDYECHALESTN
ncbi:MAG: hypothetical protein HY824_17790 [Acidobacteria bacterium]|nr:hypothetical protein [Acidobacteriota bacterium]